MRKDWSEAEEKYMARRYHVQPVRQTAKRLNRTVASVKHKAQRMGINVYTGEIIHASTIADCFHIDMRVVKRWIEKLGLPAKISQHDNATWYRIEQKDFWKWAEQNRSSINWEKYELRSLPPEPEWVKEEKKTYTTPKHRTTVTKEDVYKVQCLLHRGMSFPEIGREIGRTTESAKHIARKYGL